MCKKRIGKLKKGSCRECFEEFHQHCVERLMIFDEYTCYNCKKGCELCGTKYGMVVYCDICSKVYHKSCFINGPKDVDYWICSFCGERCSTCQKMTKEYTTESCISCTRAFHKSCLIDQKCPQCTFIKYSREVHKIRSQYNQKWVQERITALTTQILKETQRMQNVEVTIYINDDVHIIGPGRDNKIAIVLREEIKEGHDNGIDVDWDFKTKHQYFKDITIATFQEIKNVFKGLWEGIVQILNGVTQYAIEGSK